jgi:hypothetical protein
MSEVALSNYEAARVLGISPSTLAKMRLPGRCGPVFRKVGRRVVYLPQDLRSFLDSCERRNTSESMAMS